MWHPRKREAPAKPDPASMMKTIEGQSFEGINSWDGHRQVENVRFVRCRFLSCFTAPAESPENRFLIRNAETVGCSQQGCSLHTTALEEVVVDGLSQSGRSPLFFWSCVFRHVAMRGVLGAPKVNAQVRPEPTPRERMLWEHANAGYYQSVDWALDLREARFKTIFDLPGVPASLVRRDPETQFVLRRETVASSDWKSRPGDLASVIVDAFVASGAPDVVVVVGRASRKFREDLVAMQELRRRGLAEPD